MPRPLFVNRFLVRLDREQQPSALLRYDPQLRLMVTSDGRPFVQTVSPRAMGTEVRTLPQYDRERPSTPQHEHRHAGPEASLEMDTRLGTRDRDPDPERGAGSSAAGVRARRGVSAERPHSVQKSNICRQIVITISIWRRKGVHAPATGPAKHRQVLRPRGGGGGTSTLRGSPDCLRPGSPASKTQRHTA